MKSQLSLAGSFPYLENNEGPVTPGYSDNDTPTQQWQLFPVGSSTFMLRTKASGPNGYLACTQRNRSMAPRIFDHPETDSSMLWTINAWGDGTFYLSNKANGRASYLDFRGAGSVSMSTNTTQPQPGQAFSFLKLSQINDSAFSSVRPPPSSSSKPTSSSTFHSTFAGTTATLINTSVFARTIPAILTSSAEPASPTTTSPPQSPTAPAQAQRTPNSLSTSSAMGVGVTIGVFGLITLTAISIFIYQRWGPRRPESLHYRRAKMWDGFTPAINGAPKLSSRSHSPDGESFLAELPVSPAAVFSPVVTGDHMSWDSHASWLAYSPCSPGSPRTPPSPPIELPV